MRKSVSIILLILGLGIFIFGVCMSNEVAQEEADISQAEANVQGSRRPIIGPVRRNIRESAAETAQGNINEAAQKVVQSRVTANWLQGIGIVVFVAGIGCLIFSCCRKKRDS